MGLLEPTHLILIALAALIFLGPKRIPEFMKGLGKGMGELQKGINEGKAALNNAMHDIHSDTPAASSVDSSHSMTAAESTPNVPKTDTVTETPHPG